MKIFNDGLEASVYILLVQAFLAPSGLPIALFLVLANLFIAYYYRDRFKPLFQ